MTLPVNDRRSGPLTGGPNFPFDFKVKAKEDIKVVLTTAAGAESTLVLDSDYTVALNADQDNNPGGTVAYVLTVGNNVTILGNVPFSQGQSLPNGGGWFPKNVEDALDRLTMIAQQLGEKVDRAIVRPIATLIANVIMPDPSAGKFLRGRSDGLGWENADITGSGVIGIPVSIAQGGTGGTTQGTAQTGLGAGAMGKTLFAAADASTANTALGVIGKEPIWVPWGALKPRATSGPTSASSELTGTGKVNPAGWDFDPNTAQYLQAIIKMPKAWDHLSLTFVPVWVPLVVGTGNVIWGFSAQAAGDGDSIDFSTFTSVTVTDAYIAQNVVQFGPESGVVTPAGAVTNDIVVIEVKRDAANGLDTFTQLARLLGVMVFYTTTQPNEA